MKLEKFLNWFGLTTLKRLRTVEYELAYFTENLKAGNSFIQLKGNSITENKTEMKTVFVMNEDFITVKNCHVAGIYITNENTNGHVEKCYIENSINPKVNLKRIFPN